MQEAQRPDESSQKGKPTWPDWLLSGVILAPIGVFLILMGALSGSIETISVGAFLVPVGFLALPAFLVCSIVARRRARRAGHCTKCGYNLYKNTSGVCPECGLAIADARTTLKGPGTR